MSDPHGLTSAIPPPCVGRFAPSPTGPVHFGTLITATASYLQARTQQGQWRLRIDDIDETRTIEGMDRRILRSLEAHGFEWDGEIDYASRHKPAFQAAFDALRSLGVLFPCTCSRKQLADQAGGVADAPYPGNCRQRRFDDLVRTAETTWACRIRVPSTAIGFFDRCQGAQHQNLATAGGDFIIRRRDGLFAYQLAVVVDNHHQRITEVVRGCDLLDSTARQIHLQRLLGYTTPAYLHLPVATDPAGHKLSKSTGSAKVNDAAARHNLYRALLFLGQQPPADLPTGSLDDGWKWAFTHWDATRIPSKKAIVAA